MKKLVILTLLILLLTTSTAMANTINEADLETFMNQTIQSQLEKHNIPGATVSVVADGKVVLSKGYGFAELREKTMVDADQTSFRIGSVSKLFTWTAVMQLVEEGKLDLDADVNTYLDFTIPSRLLENRNNTEPAPITLAHLMTHTAGFEDIKEGLFYFTEDEMKPLDEYLRTHMPERVFPPGKITAYSNYGAALAGYIVERVSGMPFAQYVEKNIFTPLNMKNSTFRQPLPKELSPFMARASNYVNGQYIEDNFMFVPEPAGSMSSTASDMAKFMIAHLANPQRHKQQFTNHPRLDGMAYGLVENNLKGQQFLFHGGSTFVFNSGLYLLPEQNIGLFVSYSGANYQIPPALFLEFMDHFFPASDSLVLQAPEGAKARAVKFVGEYLPNSRSFTTEESLLSLLEAIRITSDEAGNLLVNYMDVTTTFVEVEPGIYQRQQEDKKPVVYGALRTLVFEPDPAGKLMLLTDGKMTYSKSPWYATTAFTFPALIVVVLFLVVSLAYWGIRLVIHLIRRKELFGQELHQPKAATAARWTAATFGLLALGFLFGTVFGNQTNPLYGVPDSVFGILPPWSPIIDKFPAFMALLGIALAIFTVIIWLKGYWQILTRLHYTLYTFAALALIWIFYYWNLLLVI